MTAPTIVDGNPYVLALGDSLVAGYGLAPAEAFPAQLEKLLRSSFPTAVVQNAGVSGNTSADALRRLPRLLSSLRCKPDLAIVELGANDLIRGVALARTRSNLDAILIGLAQCGIPALLAAMEAPRFLGELASTCDAIYTELAAKHRVEVWPFFPPGVMGNPSLTLRDRLHPNARAISMVARHFLPAVRNALRATRDLGAIAVGE